MSMTTFPLTGPAARHESAGSNLAGSFGVAAGVVIAGVLAAWVIVKHDAPVTADALLDRETQIVGQSVQRGANASGSLLEQAEIAFAAGRIIEPEFDNALSYYQSLLESEPGNAEATLGIERVTAYLENQAEGAIFQNDWDAARAYAAVILDVQGDDARGRDLRNRANRLERIEALTAKSLEQISRGNLVTPQDDNAADSYRAILQLDAANLVAAQGMRSIVQRLVANAQSATIAGKADKAQKFLAAARAIDPNAAGIADIERASKQAKPVAEADDVQGDLLAASQALQAEQLMPPATPNAFDLFNAVLAREPKSAAALQGLQLVRDVLVDRAGALIAAGLFEQADPLLLQAKAAGVDSTRLTELGRELSYQTRLKDAREGRFARVYAVSELKTVRQVAPIYPRSAAAKRTHGWADIVFTVTEQGDVRDAKAKDSSLPIFEGAAVSAISRWRFEPVIEEGRPIPVRAIVRFTFRD